MTIRDFDRDPATEEERARLRALYAGDMGWRSDDFEDVISWLMDRAFLSEADVALELRGIAVILARVVARMATATPSLGTVHEKRLVRGPDERIAAIRERVVGQL